MNFLIKIKFKKMRALSSKLFHEMLDDSVLREQLSAVRISVTDVEKRRNKSKLPAVMYHGALDKNLYKEYKKQCKNEGVPSAMRLKERNISFMRPTGLFMMDFDRDTDCAEMLYDNFCRTIEQEGISVQENLALAHRSPSGNGLRLVLKRRQGHSIEEDQKWIGEIMNEDYDTKCKSLMTLSYMVTRKDFFYLNESILFDESLGEGFVNDQLWSPDQPLPTKATKKSKRRYSLKKKKPQSLVGQPPLSIDGDQPSLLVGVNQSSLSADGEQGHRCGSDTWSHNLVYPNIVSIDEDRLIRDLVSSIEQDLGKAISEMNHNRNNSYFKMACHLTELVDDSDLVEHLLQKTSLIYGHNFPLEEIHSVTQSAANYKHRPNSFIPFNLCKYINGGSYFIARKTT